MNKIFSLGMTFILMFLIIGFLGCAQKQNTIPNSSVAIVEEITSEEVVAEEELIKPTIIKKENNAPELERGALLYAINGNVISYKFQIVYKDADDEQPIYLYVYINGSRREMTKANESQIDPKNSILYILLMSSDELYKLAPNAKDWDISYWFRSNDGHGIVETEKIDSFVMDFEAMGLIMEGGSGGGGKCNCGS